MALWGDDAWGDGSWGIFSVVPDIIDQTPTLYAPTVPQRVTVGLLDQSGVLFTPRVRRGVNVDLIDQSPVVYAFGGSSQVVDLSEPFQRDTFQVV